MRIWGFNLEVVHRIGLMHNANFAMIICRIRLNFLNHLEDWTEQAAERAASVVVAKVNLFPYTLNFRMLLFYRAILPSHV